MEIYDFLEIHNIEFERHDHPAVFTCEEANALMPDLPGAKVKNLFLRDRKGKQHYLVVVSDRKQVDLVRLSERMKSTQLSLGWPDRLQKHLGVKPGAVSLLAVVNDTAGTVQVILDEALSSSRALQCHPLVNTSTLVVSREGIEKLLKALNHEPLIIDVPGQC
jgi:Ala-tRNA(Pro) deacylase